MRADLIPPLRHFEELVQDSRSRDLGTRDDGDSPIESKARTYETLRHVLFARLAAYIVVAWSILFPEGWQQIQAMEFDGI